MTYLIHDAPGFQVSATITHHPTCGPISPPMNEGKSVWLILPDWQVRLDSTGSGKYSNGISVLTTDGTNASMTDGPSISYLNCSTLPKSTAK